MSKKDHIQNDRNIFGCKRKNGLAEDEAIHQSKRHFHAKIRTRRGGKEGTRRSREKAASFFIFPTSRKLKFF